MKAQFDRRVCPGDELVDGEIFIKCPPASTGEPTKGSAKYKGPYVVVQKVSGDIYKVQDLKKEGSESGLVNVHISQVRPWKPQLSDDTDRDSDEGEDTTNIETEVNA